MGVRGEIFSNRVVLPNRTYFFNVKENRMGDLYLNIVESKNRETGGFERQSVILFADDLQEFLKGFEESLKVLEKAVREKRRGGSVNRFEKSGESGDKIRGRGARSRDGERSGSSRERSGERQERRPGSERGFDGERGGKSRDGERSGRSRERSGESTQRSRDGERGGRSCERGGEGAQRSRGGDRGTSRERGGERQERRPGSERGFESAQRSRNSDRGERSGGRGSEAGQRSRERGSERTQKSRGGDRGVKSKRIVVKKREK